MDTLYRIKAAAKTIKTHPTWRPLGDLMKQTNLRIPQRVHRAILNISQQGLTKTEIATRMRLPSATVQQAIDELMADNKLHETRSMKRTTYHTTMQQGRYRSAEEEDVNLIRSELERNAGRKFTRQDLARRLGLSQERLAASLNVGVVKQQFHSSNVGAMSLYYA